MNNEEKLTEMLEETELDNQIEVIKADEDDDNDGACTERICGPKQ